MTPCGTRYPRLIDRAFVGPIAGWRQRRLRRHLATCAWCRDRYDRLAVVDRQLGLGVGALSPAAIDRLAQVIGVTRPDRRAVWAGVGALATAGVVIALLATGRRDGTPELRPRGGVVVGDRQPGVRLFCIGGDRDGPKVIAEARVVSVAGLAPPLRCNLDAELQLAYSSPDLEGLTMVAYGRRESTLYYYAPRSADAEGVRLRPDQIDEPLDWSTRLGVKHEAGSYEIVVRFFDRPVTAAEAVAGGSAWLAELRGTMVLEPGGAHDDR